MDYPRNRYHSSYNSGSNGPQDSIDTEVRVNFYRVSELPSKPVYHYDVTINPEASIDVSRKIIEKLRDDQGDNKLTPLCVYDGRKTLLSPEVLPFPNTCDFKVDLSPPGKRINKSFKVTLKKVNAINFKELLNDINDNKVLSTASMTAVMALDIIIRYKPTLTNVIVGRSFFTKDEVKKISNGLELWRGYYQACRATHKEVLVNIDVTATAFYQHGNLIDVATSVVGRQSPLDLRRVDDRDMQRVKSFLKGVEIQVSHRGATTKKYKIKNFSQNPANRCYFEMEGGVRTEVASYFQEKYNIKLNYPFLPCVIVGKDIHLPMEVCEVVQGQKFPKKLNERQTADMIKFTCLTPSDRINRVINAARVMNYRQNEYLKEFGVSIQIDLPNIKAKVLPPPLLKYNESKSTDSNLMPFNGVWKLRNHKLFHSPPIESYAIISFNERYSLNQRDIETWFYEFTRNGRALGMTFDPNQYLIHISNPQANPSSELNMVYKKVTEIYKVRPQIIFVILPNSSPHFYNQIKRTCDMRLGVPSQCLQSRHLKRPNAQYCINVCLKTNAKIGGVNTNLPHDQIPLVSEEPTIVIGADLNQAAKGERNQQAIATLVGTINDTASAYTSCIEYQPSGDLMIKSLKRMVMKALDGYIKSTGIIPTRVIIYRDGVPDGQFKPILEYEIDQIKRAFEELRSPKRPKVTYIAVQKRHHVRFFPLHSKTTDNSGNCAPGTIIQSQITEPGRKEFFLQSHAGIQGTSRSTHYYVLEDKNDFQLEQIQKLSYYLCYTYARCTRSVSLVPPVYYAHLVSTRAKAYRNYRDDHRHPEDRDSRRHQELENTLYFV